MKACKHGIVMVDFKQKKAEVCTLCMSETTFHVDNPSFDYDKSSIDGQKQIYKKLIENPLVATIDLEKYIDRWDAVIPKDEHHIQEMHGMTMVKGNKAHYVLETVFKEPHTGQLVTQYGILTQVPLRDLVLNMKKHPDIRQDLNMSHFKDWSIVERNCYIHNGIEVAGEVNIMPHYTEIGRETENILSMRDYQKDKGLELYDGSVGMDSTFKICAMISMFAMALLLTGYILFSFI